MRADLPAEQSSTGGADPQVADASELEAHPVLHRSCTATYRRERVVSVRPIEKIIATTPENWIARHRTSHTRWR